MKNIVDFLKRFGFIVFNAIVLILLLVIFARAQGIPDKNAQKFIELGQTKKAIEVLERSIQENPDDASRYYYLGYAQLVAGDQVTALQTFEKGIAKNEKEPLNYAGKGHALLIAKKTSEAKIQFDKALTLSKSKNVPVLQAVGRAYVGDKSLAAEAVVLLEKAKAIEPQNPETFVLLGDAYYTQNNGGSAISNYEWAAQFDPTTAKPHYKIGMLYLRTREFKISEESFLKAIQVDPGYAPAYKELAELSYLSRNGVQAVKYFETYMSLTEVENKDQLRYAYFLFMARDFTKANEIFRKINTEDVSPAGLRYYAYSLFEAGDYQQSREAFEKYFFKTNKQEYEALDYAYYGKLLAKLNEDSLAVTNLLKSIELDKNQVDALRLAAEVQLKRKKYSESIRLYRQLMANVERPLSQDRYSIGKAYYFNEQFPQADSSFSELIRLQPAMGVGYLWEARTKSSLDPESENGLAKPFYEKVVEIESANPEKFKHDLVEAYSYLGYYHFLKQEIPVSKSYWQKVLTLSPDNEKAKEALKAFN